MLRRLSPGLSRPGSGTCVVQAGSSVQSWDPVGLDQPLGSGPGLSGPTAEGQEVEVAGEPNVRCRTEETREEQAGQLHDSSTGLLDLLLA